MVEFTKWELTDEELSKCISKCHENFLNSSNTEETNEWRWLMTVLLSEQRRRMDLMLKEVNEDNPLNYRYRQMMACYGHD